MSFFESILYMMWRGIAIGVMISAPMGPVGILCIQRTLERGRKAGLYTGIGAALSDLVYCLITGFGLSFIELFLEQHQNLIQILGSLVLIAFSIYLFRKNPSSSLRRPVPEGVSAKKNILGGFLFTFSNPLILFLIIGLFARFNFLMPEIKFYHYMIGFLFILIGALGWWYAVTYIIDKVRSRFSFRTMKGVNIAIGIIILIFAVVGIITGIIGMTSPAHAAAPRHQIPYSLYRNERRGMSPFADTLACDPAAGKPLHRSIPTGLHSPDQTLEFCFTAADINLGAPPKVSLRHSNQPSPLWGVTLSGRCEGAETQRVELLIEATPSTDPLMPQYAICGVTRTSAITNHTHITDQNRNNNSDRNNSGNNRGCNNYGSENRFLIDDANLSDLARPNRFRVTLNNGLLTLCGGQTCTTPIASAHIPGLLIDSIGITTYPGAAIRLSDIALKKGYAPSYPEDALSLYPQINADNTISDSADTLEGIWSLLDYSLDTDRLRRGGDYTLQIIRSDNYFDPIVVDPIAIDPIVLDPIVINPVVTDSIVIDPIVIDPIVTNPIVSRNLYLILYLDGATVNARAWHRGMLKGVLQPTDIPDIYTLTWFDSFGKPIANNLRAHMQAENILTLHFPTQSSEIRLHRHTK